MHQKIYEKAEKIVAAIKNEKDWDKIEKHVKQLQELEVLSSSLIFRKEKGEKYSLAGLYFADGKELAEGLEKYWINPTVKDKCHEQELGYIKENVKVGTEFTFHHDAFQFTLEDLEKNRAGKGIDVGKAIIEQWTEQLIRNYPYENKWSYFKITAKNTGRGKKKFENAEYNAVEIEFTFEDTLQAGKRGNPVKWKVNFDLDPSCIELQTQPMPYCFFEQYEPCIDELLFNHISNYGLKADKSEITGGGGHISLDTATAFFQNAIYLRNFLVLYTCEAKKAVWERASEGSQQADSFLAEEQRQLLIACRDMTNAPFLFELQNEERLFKGFISKFDGERMDLNNFVIGMNNQVYINVTDELERLLGDAGKVTAEDGQHYQAVNLEHVSDQGRIEMRRFDAQESINELLEQLDVLFEILRMARTNWKISIDKALTGDYFAD